MADTLHLGPFRLLEPMARGGMGEVWRGIHARQRVPVAVKVLRPNARQKEAHPGTPRWTRWVERFRFEVRAMAGLDHPGIVHVLDHGLVPSEAASASEGRLPVDSPYLVMELASGGSLSQLPQIRDWATLRAVLLSILDALAHAHARGVIHRDIKPGNVLLCLSSDLRPGLKLTDFGIAQALSAREPTDKRTGPVGTFKYMSPEQVEGQVHRMGPWTDLYALGATAWRLATGGAPFEGNPGQVMRAHLIKPVGTFEPKLDVPIGFREWLHCLLAKEPEDRFKRAADAAAALLQIGTTGPAPRRLAEATPSANFDLEISDPTTLALEGLEEGWNTAWRATSFDDQRDDPAAARVMSKSWRHPVPPPPPLRLVGAGLGVFGLRELRLVGRESERDALWDALRQVHSDQEPAVMVIRGPAGVGKTALARWLCYRAHELGLVEVISVNHNPMSRPVTALRQALTRSLRARELDESVLSHQIRRLVRDEEHAAALTALLSPSQKTFRGPAVALATERERHAAVQPLLDAMAESRTLLVLLDDVHWGDEALGLAHFVLDQSLGQDRRILFVCTAQDEELAPDSVAARRLAALEARQRTRTMKLQALPPADTRALVRELLFLESTIAAQVEERASGNPLFAIQLVEDWVERDLLKVTENGFTLKDKTPPLPDSLAAVWDSRVGDVLDRLYGERGARDALERASALGMEVDDREWGEVCGPGSEEVRRHLKDALLAARLAAATDQGFRFTHSIFRAAVEKSARDGDRWATHNAACADFLAREHGRDPGAAERLGRHFLEAGMLAEALERILTGIDQRRLTVGYRPSLSLLGDAERAMAEMDLTERDPRWGNLWVTRALLCKLQGEYDEALAWSEQAIEAARKHLSDTPKAGIALHVGLEDKGWDQVLRRGLLENAQSLLHRHQLASADAVLKEAVARAEKSGDRHDLASALYVQAGAAIERRDNDAAEILLVRAEANFRKGSDELGLADCWAARGNVDVHRGNLDSAESLYRKAQEIYAKAGRRLGAAHATNGLAEVSRRRGDLIGAEQGYRRAHRLFRAIGAGQAVVPQMNIGMVLLLRGQLPAAREPLEEARRVLEHQERLGLLGAVNAVLLPTLAHAKEWSEWDRAMQEARLLLFQTGLVDTDIAWAAALAGELANDDKETERAQDAFALATSQYDRLGDVTEVRRLANLVQSIHQ